MTIGIVFRSTDEDTDSQLRRRADGHHSYHQYSGGGGGTNELLDERQWDAKSFDVILFVNNWFTKTTQKPLSSLCHIVCAPVIATARVRHERANKELYGRFDSIINKYGSQSGRTRRS